MTQYDQKPGKGSVFTRYIAEIFCAKKMASEYPAECTTNEDQERYVEELKETEGITLNEDSICYNAGLRSVAKLCLNSLWGKLAQRKNMTKTEVIAHAERLTELLTSSEVDVNGILLVDDETLCANWCYKDEAMVSSSTSVVIAVFTTAQVRLEFFKYLDALGPRALYYDTDSVFFLC